jgi:nicotinate phosphoribosyltransferase
MFRDAAQEFGVDLSGLRVVASNEINEDTLHSLNQQGHDIDVFGVGTHLVTCKPEPSLGCVYKLVQIGDLPRIKLSQERAKRTIPGRKEVYRLTGEAGHPLVDLMVSSDEEPPRAGERVLCCHPFDETKRTYVVPTSVDPLHHCYWGGGSAEPVATLREARDYCLAQLDSMREDHLRLLNPTPYKVSVSRILFEHIRDLWLREMPLGEIR